MRFALSPEQLDFGTSVRKLLDAGRTPAAVRAWAAGDPRPGRSLIRQLAGAGVLGLTVEESNGGIGADPIDLVVAFLEIGRAAAPGPWSRPRPRFLRCCKLFRMPHSPHDGCPASRTVRRSEP